MSQNYGGVDNVAAELTDEFDAQSWPIKNRFVEPGLNSDDTVAVKSALKNREKPTKSYGADHDAIRKVVSSPPSVRTGAGGANGDDGGGANPLRKPSFRLESANNNNNNGANNVIADFDDILPHIGEFGTYQIILFLLTAPFCFFLAFSYFSQVFITLIPDHWCAVPELNNSGLTIQEIRNLSVPITVPPLGGLPTFDSCLMYDVNYTEILRSGRRTPDVNWPQVSCKSGWNYDYSETRYPTAVSEFNLVCDNANKAPLAQAIFFCGSIVGGIAIGYIADKFGRIPALISCNMVGALAGLITYFANSFGVFAFARFLMGIAFDNCFTMMYILVLEYVGPSYRTLTGNLCLAIFYAGGTTVLPWIAWACNDWRVFSLATGLPMATSLAAYWIVPESARWLLSQGQSDRAIGIIRKFAKINKKEIDEKLFQQLKASTEAARKASENQATRSVLDLFKTPRMRRITILLTLLWVLVAIVYDGHARNTANLGLSVFLTFSVASATELPADLLLVFFLDRWGRRIFAFGSLLGAAIFSLVTLAVPLDQAALSATLAIIGRFCVNITFNIGMQYGAELIPTEVRAQGIAAVHIAGYIASMISPYIVDLARFSPILPLLVLGILAFAGAIVGLLLPETLGTILPETLEDGENFGKDQSFWQFPICSSADKSVEEDIEMDRETSMEPEIMQRASLTRTSLRGEVLRSSLISRSSLQRKSMVSKATVKRTATTKY